MKNFEFTPVAPQELLAQVQATGQKTLDTAQQAFATQAALIQENTQAAFGLMRSALDIRDVDGFKSFMEEASRNTREAIERSTQVAQAFMAEQVKSVQDVASDAKSAKKRA